THSPSLPAFGCECHSGAGTAAMVPLSDVRILCSQWTELPRRFVLYTKARRLSMLRRITRAGLPLTSVCFALIASATQGVTQQAPVIQVGSDTRAKSAASVRRMQSSQ